MPFRMRVFAIAMIAVVSSQGCSSARMVVRDPNGGVVAIPDNSDKWPSHHRKAAEELMAAQCPNGYVIESEKTVVVGRNALDTKDVTELHIHFHDRLAMTTPAVVKQPASTPIQTSAPIIVPARADVPAPLNALPAEPVPVPR